MFILFKNKSGMSLVEVIIASAIVLLISSFLITTNLTYFKTSNSNLKSIKAIYLAEEGVEAVNFIADDWNSLGENDTDYYLIWDGSVWLATTTQNYIDEVYDRKFITESVERNSADEIVLAGGVVDSNTRKVTVHVSYLDTSGTTTKSISTYVFKPNE
jgi:prepilin-type N-terminal cleavage/methylation domain-containing protein